MVDSLISEPIRQYIESIPPIAKSAYDGDVKHSLIRILHGAIPEHCSGHRKYLIYIMRKYSVEHLFHLIDIIRYNIDNTYPYNPFYPGLLEPFDTHQERHQMLWGHHCCLTLDDSFNLLWFDDEPESVQGRRGYKAYQLNGRTVYWHHIVQRFFHGSKNPKSRRLEHIFGPTNGTLCTNHIDENKSNNHISNLESITVPENYLWSFYRAKTVHHLKGLLRYRVLQPAN